MGDYFLEMKHVWSLATNKPMPTRSIVEQAADIAETPLSNEEKQKLLTVITLLRRSL